ncbi:hypothetical protein K6T13_10325 [Nocardioides coralli]|nr:hypothetical protein K6T13_10325 [Nocardioides coralli]
MIEYDGHTYWGQAQLMRRPEVSGRTVTVVRPGCEDSGGQGEVEQDTEVEARELADVGPETAVLVGDSLFVREGRDLPEQLDDWFRSPPCTSPGRFELTAQWLGITSPNEPRFDGDVQAPYRLEVRVTDGPTRYVDATITIRATTGTHPALQPGDVESSLWEGGFVIATVRCDGEDFVATGIVAHPPDNP